MGQTVDVFVITRAIARDHLELALEEVNGTGRRWSKMYDGSLFLNMDAQSLGLLEPLPDRQRTGPKYRLKRSGTVPLDLLARMRFVEGGGQGLRDNSLGDG